MARTEGKLLREPWKHLGRLNGNRGGDRDDTDEREKRRKVRTDNDGYMEGRIRDEGIKNGAK